MAREYETDGYDAWGLTADEWAFIDDEIECMCVPARDGWLSPYNCDEHGNE
jgi:hypothetical protein